MVFLLALSKEICSFFHHSPCLVSGGRFDVFFAFQCYIQIFVHPSSHKNPYPYTFCLNQSRSPTGFMPRPLTHCGLWSPVNLYVVRVALVSLLMSHPASKTTRPCGLCLHSFPLLSHHSCLWPLLRPCHHLECFSFWNIKLQFPT